MDYLLGLSSRISVLEYMSVWYDYRDTGNIAVQGIL